MKVNLNLEKVEAKQGTVDVLPTGRYNATIIGCDVKETKAKDGHYFHLFFQVIDGDQSGKVFDDILNVANKSADTQRWALASLKTILTHGGHKNPNMLQDSDELVGLTVNVRLESVKETYEGKVYDKNKVKGYTKAEAAPAVTLSPVASVVVNAPPVIPPVIPSAPVVAPPAVPGQFPWGAPR